MGSEFATHLLLKFPMKKILILLLFIYSVPSYAQFWKYDSSYRTNINVERRELIYKPNNCFSFIDYSKGVIYFKLTSRLMHDRDIVNDGIGMKFFSYSLKEQKKDSGYIKIPSKYINEMKPQDVLSGFAANEKFAIIKLVNSKILLFSKMNINSNQFLFKSEIANEFCFNGEFYPLNDGRFLLVNYYNYHPLDCRYKTVISILDPDKGNLAKTIIFDKVEGIELSQTAHKWVDVSANRILFCEPKKKLLKIFNHSLDLIDSFNLNTEISQTKTEALSTLTIFEKTDYIEKTYLVNDSNILVSINDGTGGSHRDIYIISLRDKKVICTIEDLDISMPHSVNTELPNRDGFWHSIFWQNIPEFHFFNNKVISLTTVYFPEYWKEVEITNDEYRELLRKYSATHTEQYGINVYRIICLHD